MKITVIGAGNMGAAFVRQLARAGHQVSVTARDTSKAARVAAAHPGARAVAVAGAAAGAEAVVLATGYADAVARAAGRRRPEGQGGHRHHQSADGRLHGPDDRP